jgi:hypothetical protein
MISLLITMFLACGDKEEEQDTAVDAEDTAVTEPNEPSEEPAAEGSEEESGEETEESEEGSEEGEE